MAESFLSGLFLPHNVRISTTLPYIFYLRRFYTQITTPEPVTMWELAEEFAIGRRDSVWAVFRTHEEVRYRFLPALFV